VLTTASHLAESSSNVNGFSAGNTSERETCAVYSPSVGSAFLGGVSSASSTEIHYLAPTGRADEIGRSMPNGQSVAIMGVNCETWVS